VSKHSQEEELKEATTAPSDTDTEQVEDTVTDAAETADEPTEVTEDESSESAEPEEPKRRIQWTRVFAFAVLPAVALLLAIGAGYLKWTDNSVRDNGIARVESVQAAKDSTIALLSYKPDTVEQQLTAARDLLSGDFRDSYTSLTNDVVIPGAKQKQVSAVATVPAIASVSADPRHAVVLVFVNQTVVVGQTAPTDTASSVRVTLDKVGDRWLISKFDPV
jgi:Mce-associated membrane protein